jgi:hypothetical protein
MPIHKTWLPPGHGAGCHSAQSTIEAGNGAQSTIEAGNGRNGAGPPQETGTSAGTRNETARRRLIVEELTRAGLSIRMISEVTDIPRSSVHRAMCAVARAEARKQVAITEIAARLLGKKLSHQGRRAT